MRRRQFIALVSGIVVVRSLLAHAQQSGSTFRLAVIHPSLPVTSMLGKEPGTAYHAFFGELQRLGYVEGKNLLVERYSGEGRIEHYAELARMVVQLNPNAIFALSSRMVWHFKAETNSIPIAGIMADPVSFGLVASLARPGGNVTGVTPDAGLETVWFE